MTQVPRQCAPEQQSLSTPQGDPTPSQPVAQLPLGQPNCGQQSLLVEQGDPDCAQVADAHCPLAHWSPAQHSDPVHPPPNGMQPHPPSKHCPLQHSEGPTHAAPLGRHPCSQPPSLQNNPAQQSWSVKHRPPLLGLQAHAPLTQP